MKLYLTDSECYLDSSIINVNFIRLEFVGTPIIEGTIPIDYTLYLYKNTLNIIRNTKNSKSAIDSLFKYKGRVGIRKAIIFLNNELPKNIKIINKKFPYIIQNILTLSEDMSLPVDEMKLKIPIKVGKIKLKKNAITNIKPKRQLYNKDGTNYNGLIHQVLDGPNALAYYTGATPSKDSKLLYGKKRTTLFKPAVRTNNERAYYLSIERMRNKKNVIY